MVNQGIVNYLRRFSGRFPLNQLKSALINEGKDPKEVDEAIAFIQGETVETKTPSTGESTLMETLKWGAFAGLASGGVKFVMEFISNIFNIVSTTFSGYIITLFVAVFISWM